MGPKKTKTTPRILSKGRGGKSVPSAASGSSSTTAQPRSGNVVHPVVDVTRAPTAMPRTSAFRGSPQNIPGMGGHQVPLTKAELAGLKRASQKIKKPKAARGRGAQASGREGFQQQLLLRQEQEKQQMQKQRKMEIAQMGSFFLWLNDNRSKLEEENPQIAGTSYLVIKAGKMWRSLAPAERLIHDSKMKRTAPAFIAALIELGREDFDDEFTSAKAQYDAFFPTEPQVKTEINLV